MVSVFPGAAHLINNQCLSNPVSLATEGINPHMTIPLFTTPSICPPSFLRRSWLTSCFLGDFAAKSPALFCFKPPKQQQSHRKWSGHYEVLYGGGISGGWCPTLPTPMKKRLCTCFSSWPEFKKQLQWEAHIGMGKTVPSPSEFQRLQDVSSLFPIISHWRDTATHSVQKCQCQMTRGILCKHFRGCLRSWSRVWKWPFLPDYMFVTCLKGHLITATLH